MLIFKLERIDGFVEATAVLAGISTRCHFKLSAAMFSLYVYHHSLRCNIALQIMPPFFTTYNFFDQNPNSSFYIENFFRALLNFQRSGCSSLSFALDHHLPRVELISEGSCLTQRVIELPLSPAEEKASTEIDYSVFVSIDLQDFKPVATMFDRAPYVRVTLSHSGVRFAYEDEEITLTAQRNECIVGGVGAGDSTQLILTPIPLTSFYNMTGHSKRVWIFKSNHKYSAVLTAPIGLYSTFFVYLPQLI
ncbi:uncharacterized protein LOC111023103 [Momordica charantia]|uniref:Uncharacterized protein LOC111023084 n=1 Tax=Momordica charantia TaxID=3673 RepID=A0A6J1DTY7_MOMCH|nr:uncharacterized protein LOC111023084 [Momordica charantia]XP_022156146.1 uncharacterized protein LOC111023103 [Momordica charantia]